MEFIPLLWLLFAIAAALAARSKNRSGLIFFLLGFLIGPFSLLFALLINRKPLPTTAPPEPIQAIIPLLPTKTCPLCAEEIKLAALICKHCGHNLDPADTAALVAAYEAQSANRQAAIAAGEICPACNTPLTNAFYNGGFGPWCPTCRQPVIVPKP